MAWRNSAFKRRVGPPGEGTDVHDAAGARRVAAKEAEHLGGRSEQVAVGGIRLQDFAVIKIVEDQAGTERRQTEEDRQRRDR